LLGHGAQLVDVLPAEEYHDQHLPAAVSMPLKELSAKTTPRFRMNQPIIVGGALLMLAGILGLTTVRLNVQKSV